MKKLLMIALMSIGVYNLNAQCQKLASIDPNCDLTKPYYINAGGYRIKYYQCGSYVKMDSITFLGSGTAPDLSFINIAIPAIFDDPNLNVELIYYPATCVKWEKGNCTNVMLPVPNTFPQRYRYEGQICKYTLADCNGIGCCSWTRQGDGMPEEINYDNSKALCEEPSFPSTQQVCFPLCDQQRKMAKAPAKGESYITISPNPAQDFISFSSIASIHSVVIYDVVGKIMYSDALTSNRLDISRYQQGLYFVQINRTDGYIEARKFEKK